MAHLNDRSRGDLLDPVRHHFKLRPVGRVRAMATGRARDECGTSRPDTRASPLPSTNSATASAIASKVVADRRTAGICYLISPIV